MINQAALRAEWSWAAPTLQSGCRMLGHMLHTFSYRRAFLMSLPHATHDPIIAFMIGVPFTLSTVEAGLPMKHKCYRTRTLSTAVRTYSSHPASILVLIEFGLAREDSLAALALEMIIL